MAAFGCISTWSLALTNQGNEKLLTELRTADVLNSTVQIIFGDHGSGATATLDRCDIDWIYRYSTT